MVFQKRNFFVFNYTNIFILVYSTLFLTFQGGLQFLATFRLLYLIFGWPALIVLSFLIPILLAIFFSAAIFSLLSLVVPPMASNLGKTDISKIGLFLITVVALQLLANLITLGVGWGIVKLADYNPIAAAKVGVYGSNVP